MRDEERIASWATEISPPGTFKETAGNTLEYTPTGKNTGMFAILANRRVTAGAFIPMHIWLGQQLGLICCFHGQTVFSRKRQENAG